MRLSRQSGRTYQVKAIGPDGRVATASFGTPVGKEKLENFLLRIGRPRSGVRGFHSPRMNEARKFGSSLFGKVMAGEVRDVYVSARSVAETRGAGLRLTLFLTDVPELMGIPWEFLYEERSRIPVAVDADAARSVAGPSDHTRARAGEAAAADPRHGVEP